MAACRARLRDGADVRHADVRVKHRVRRNQPERAAYPHCSDDDEHPRGKSAPVNVGSGLLLRNHQRNQQNQRKQDAPPHQRRFVRTHPDLATDNQKRRRQHRQEHARNGDCPLLRGGQGKEAERNQPDRVQHQRDGFQRRDEVRHQRRCQKSPRGINHGFRREQFSSGFSCSIDHANPPPSAVRAGSTARPRSQDTPSP